MFRRLSLLTLYCAGAFVFGCSNPQVEDSDNDANSLLALSGMTMGTTYSVKVSQPPPGVVREELQAQIDGILEAINADMSTYRDDSLLSRFAQHNTDEWFEVSDDLALVVAESLRVSELTDGAFDVTVAPLVNLWHFGPETGPAEIPPQDAVNRVRARIGYQHVAVRESPPGIRKDRPDISIDLSSIAKGYAVDKVTEYLLEIGVGGSLVEIGGETRTTGTKSEGKPWVIAIETPTVNQRDLHRILEFRDHAIATSGDYRIFFEKDGRRYSHTIDPRTGQPVDHALTSVSVVTSTCMEADAMATAINVLGPEEGYELAVDRDLAVLLIMREGDEFTERMTPRFGELFGP